MLRPGRARLWEDARTIGKSPGQPVLFLQTREQGAAWVGSGVVTEVEARWKAFGVYVETRKVLARLLPTIHQHPGDSAPGTAPSLDSMRSQGMSAWENRALAARVGFAEFRTSTPYLEGARDLRVSPSDWSALCRLQPALEGLGTD